MQNSHFPDNSSNRWNYEKFQGYLSIKKNQQKDALQIDNKMPNSFVDTQSSCKRLRLDVCESHPKDNRENYFFNESMYESDTSGLQSFQKCLSKEEKFQSSVNKEQYNLDKLSSSELNDPPRTGLCNNALTKESFHNNIKKDSCTSSPIYNNTSVQTTVFWKNNDFNLNGSHSFNHAIPLNHDVYSDLEENETALIASREENVLQQNEKTVLTSLEKSYATNLVKDYLYEPTPVREKCQQEKVVQVNSVNSLETNDLQSKASVVDLNNQSISFSLIDMKSWIHPSEPETSDRLSCFLNLSPKQLADMLLESVGFSNDSTLSIEKKSGGINSQTVKSIAPLQAAPSLAAATSAAATLLGFAPNDSCSNNTFIKPTLLNETFGKP
jgi:hypothetical protein